MATLKEIAEIVGVSKATVSNVFTKKKKVSPEITKRVLEVCEQLNYYPNRMAASLTTKKMNIIGLLLNDEGQFIKKYQKELIGGVFLAAHRNGYRVLVDMCSLDNKEVYNSLITGSEPMDGTIITAPFKHDERIRIMLEKNVPFVLVGRPPAEFGEDVLYVDVDNIGLVYQTVQRLVSLGHRHIGLLNSHPDTTISSDRLTGYKKALLENGIPCDDSLVYYTDNTAATGKVAAAELMSVHPDVTAVIACSDDVAVGVYEVIKKLGISIPKQMSVVALGGDDYIEMLKPRLTTAMIDYNLMGMEAVGLLLKKINKQPINSNKVITSINIIEGNSIAAVI
ncbi:MAG TPA: LacI family transcriptional regulator [Clostridiales bacterium]|nr:LacI family transcriptional regulator [Clostridiales bacterium]